MVILVLGKKGVIIVFLRKDYKMKKVIYQFQINQSEILGTFETKQENYKSGNLFSTESVTMIRYKFNDYIFTTTIDLFEIFIK